MVNISGEDDNEDEDEQVNTIQDPDDDGQSDLETDDNESDKTATGDNINVGTIVWGKHGRIWYPAVVVSRDEVPNITLQKIGRNLNGKILVKWRGENNYSALRENCVEQLA